MKDETHPAVALTRAFRERLLAPSLLDFLLDFHLAQDCTTCAQRFGERCRHLGPAAPNEQVEREFQSLMRMDPQERAASVANALTRYRSRPLVLHLIAKARAAVHDYPEEGEEFAELAEVISAKIGYPADQALSAAARANALRATGDLRQADSEFQRARRLLDLQFNSGAQAQLDRLQVAAASLELDCLESSLRKDQRQFDAAHRLLGRALAGFERAGNAAGIARALVKLSVLHRRQNRTREALAELSRALPLLDVDHDIRLTLTAHHNLAAYLLDSGDADRAALVVDLMKPLYRIAGGRLTAIRLRWLEAQIASAVGEPGRAEALLREVVRDFVYTRSPLLAACAALDLADLLLTTDRSSELATLAALVAPIFRVEGLTSEAAAAVLLFHRSLLRRETSRPLVNKLRRQLRGQT